MPDKPDHEALSRLLRAGDPAAGAPALDPMERKAMRRRLLDAHRRRRERPESWLVPVLTAAGLLALALGLAWRAPEPAPLTTAELRAVPSVTAGETSGGAHQVQFTTDNGTLVVWVLMPRNAG